MWLGIKISQIDIYYLYHVIYQSTLKTIWICFSIEFIRYLPCVLAYGLRVIRCSRTFNEVPKASNTYLKTITQINIIALQQQYLTAGPQTFLKHAIPDYLVRGTDLFPLRLSNTKMTTANRTKAIQCEWIKIIPFCQIGKKILYSLVCHRNLVISLHVQWDEKGWKSLL